MSTDIVVANQDQDQDLVAVPQNNFKTRQEAARQACEAAGIVWPDTILPEGTALYQSGVEKLKNDRAAWQRLPLAGEVVGLVQDALRSEDRKDYTMNVGALRLREFDGRIVQSAHVESTEPDFGLGYGPHTLRQLVAQIDPLDDAPRGFSSALLYLTDQERAAIVNDRLKNTNPETSVVLRTRVPHSGSRIARAALSEIYGSVTDHDLAVALGEMLNGDRSGRLDYKPGDTKSRFEVIWPSEIPVETFVVGDVHYGMLSITNSETGQGGIRIAPAVVRARCANLTISTGEGTEINIRHVGNPAELILRVKKAMRLALEDMEPLLNTISLSARVGFDASWTPAEALSKIAKRFDQPKVVAETWQKQLVESNYPASVWGLSAAISEAAHRAETWTDEAEQEKIGSLVQAKVAEVVKQGTPMHLALEKALSLN